MLLWISMCACVLGVMPLVGCADEGGGTGGVVLDLGITRFMHANLNVSDFERSHAFYETLGFASLLDVEESVSAEQAAALDMPAVHIPCVSDDHPRRHDRSHALEGSV